jgi:hypothetical protein
MHKFFNRAFEGITLLSFAVLPCFYELFPVSFVFPKVTSMILNYELIRLKKGLLELSGYPRIRPRLVGSMTGSLLGF